MDITQKEQIVYLLGKLQRNMENLSQEDISGRYKKPLHDLKLQIKSLSEDYLKTLLLADVVIKLDEEGWEVISQINNILITSVFGKRIGEVLFKRYSLEEAEKITEEIRQSVLVQIYSPYFERHICLRASTECFSQDPEIPKYYNDLVDMYLNEKTGQWYMDIAESQKDSVYIYRTSEQRAY